MQQTIRKEVNMRALYKNQPVDYNEGKTEFVKEFNQQIKDYGAIAYNHNTNTYQFIQKFEEIEFINEIYPWYFMVKPSILPNGIDIQMAYEFDPEAYTDDPEITSLWQQAVAEGQSIYDYDEEGQIFEKDLIPLTAQPTKHTVWILNEEGYKYLTQYDKLLLLPMIKYLDIAKDVIKNHTIKPFEE